MDARSALIAKRLEAPMLGAALLTIPSVIIDVGTYASPWPAIGVVLNITIWVAFLFEFVVMMLVVPDRRLWIQTHKLETFLVVASMPILPAGLAALRLVRLLRVARLARLAKLARVSFGMRGLPYIAVITFLLVLASGAAFAAIENGQKLSQWDGMWWAMTTVTTVGYGDVSPATVGGRLLALFVMFLGIGFVAILTAAVAQYFVSQELQATAGDVDRAPSSDDRHQELLSELRSIEARLAALEFRDDGESPTTVGDSTEL